MKKIISIVCAVLLALSMLMFVGCNKETNPTLYSGSNKDEALTYAKVGDFYIDETDSKLYKFTGEGWVLLNSIKEEKVAVLENVSVAYENDKYGQRNCVLTLFYSDGTSSVQKFVVPEKGFADTYELLKENIENAQNGDKINLTNDIAIEGDCDLVIDKEIVIELNGHSIAAKNDTLGNGIFRVVEGGKLTINGEGTIDGVNATEYAMAIWVDGGEVIINGGTYTNIDAGEDTQYDLIYVKNGGKLTINGGKFVCKTPKWTLNINDTNGGEIVVSGGYFECYNPERANSESEIINFVAEGYVAHEILEQNGSWHTIVEKAN